MIMRIKQVLKGMAAGFVLAAVGAGFGPGMAGQGWAAGLSADVPYAFSSVAIGGGGYIPAIVFSRAAPGVVYMRTDIGGAYRWDEAAKRWLPLLDGVGEGRLLGVESIAPDPTAPDRVYAALGMYSGQQAAIARSDNRGATWTFKPVPFAMGGNEDGRGMGERLAVDPANPQVLLFASRHDGLWRSADQGQSWAKLSSFPYGGAGKPPQYQTHGGVGFVVFDPRAGSRRVVAGVSDPGQGAVYLSPDGGATWAKAPDGPAGPVAAGMVPTRAEFGADGTLYATFDDWIGPNGVHKGAVWALSPAGVWRDITPDKSAEGGYMGLATDPKAPGVVLVASLDRWHPGDTLWRSADGGAHWDDLSKRSARDVAYSPWLDHVGGSEHMGHWMSALAIDPFHPAHVAYGTGATAFVADDVGADGAIHWRVWTQGVEETVGLSLAAPTAGDGVPVLLSGLGDIGGFAHDTLAAVPARPFVGPFMQNTNQIDYAGMAPRFVVRSGTVRDIDPKTGATLALSEDGGHNWRPLKVPALKPSPGEPGERFDLTGDASVVIGADGATLVVNTPVVLYSADAGAHWRPSAGLPPKARVIADKVDPKRFYAVEFASGLVFASSDGAQSFLPLKARDLPAKLDSLKPWNREGQLGFMAAPGRAGELWMLLKGDLYFSKDGGQSFRTLSRKQVWVASFGLGKAAPGSSWTTLYAKGGMDGVDGLFRSTDGGATWKRINDGSQRWGNEIKAITGDPQTFGRVFVGTGGRGVLVGQPRP
jgi:xyloglucan-specific exo-beta-1,4-glucanase